MKITLDELKRRVGLAYAALRCCRLCPRNCGVNRLQDELGVCHTGKIAKVASHNVHTGEEPPISGIHGSGTIFFTSCNLRCKFCQNYPISQLRHGKDAPPQELAKMTLWLQKQKCHNLNLVTPSHVVPQFLAGLYLARTMVLDSPPPCVMGARSNNIFFERSAAKSRIGDFNLPIVYNSSGYDGLEALKLLDGIVDIYMPDIKYSNNAVAEHYSSATNYWNAVRPAVKEMYRQVGDLKTDKDGIATRGLIIRHLVLPNGLAGTEKVLKFIAEEISPNTHISLMSQYFPVHHTTGYSKLGRQITPKEWQTAKDTLHKYGLENGWTQFIK